MRFSKKLLTFARITEYILVRKRFPLIINLAVTNKCNFHCAYCNIPSKNNKEMTLNDIKKVVDKLADKCVFIDLFGGEPLLREDIGEIIEYIQRKDGIYCSIFTNGWLIREKIDELSKVDCVTVSLDGPLKVHDSCRRHGSFKKAIEGIKLLGKKNVKVATNFTLNKHNAEYVNDFLKISKKLNTTPLITIVHSHDYASSQVHSILPSSSQVKEAIRLVNEFYIKEKTIFKYPNTFFKYPSCYLTRSNCIGGDIYFHIESDGKVFACPYLTGGINAPNIVDSEVHDTINKIKRNCNGCWCPTLTELNIGIKDPFNNKLAARLSNNRTRLF